MRFLKYQYLWSLIAVANIFLWLILGAFNPASWAIFYALLASIIFTFIIPAIKSPCVSWVLDISSQKCDPEAFIAAVDSIASSPFASKRVKYFLKYMKTCELAEFQKDILDELLEFDPTKLYESHAMTEMSWSGILAVRYALKGDMEETQGYFNMMKAQSYRYRRNGAAYAAAHMLMRSSEMTVAFVLGRYTECRAWYKGIADNEKLSLKIRVSAAYMYGIMIKDGNVPEAHKYFKFAAEKGNKLSFAAKAREELEKLPECGADTESELSAPSSDAVMGADMVTRTTKNIASRLGYIILAIILVLLCGFIVSWFI